MTRIIFLIIFSIFTAEISCADPLDPDKVVHCILGEARGESDIGMTAVAEAIRNRGTLKGVYGCNAVFTEPWYVYEKARQAWDRSQYTNLTNGADHWASVEIDKKWDSWLAGHMDFTVQIGGHRFYRSRD